MLMIRLQRVGKTKKASYRLIISEKARDTQGTYLEKLGTFDPHAKENGLLVDAQRVEYWISKGAQTSATIHNLFVKAGILTATKKKVVFISKERKVKLGAKDKAKQEAAVKAKADAEAKAIVEAEAKAAVKEAAKAEAEAKAAEAKATTEKPAEEIKVEEVKTETSAEVTVDNTPEKTV